MAELEAEIVPSYMDILEPLAEKNNGYLALGRLTWADIYFVGSLRNLESIVDFNLIANRPNLKQVVHNVISVESIKAWFEEQP